MDSLKKEILNLLIFKEEFSQIEADLALDITRKMLVALLKELIEDGYIKTYFNANELLGTIGFDADRVHDYLYQATAKGLAIIDPLF